MPELSEPTVDLYPEWLAGYREWGTGAHVDGAGLHDGDGVESVEDFAAYVTRLREQSDDDQPTPAGLVHCTYWWVTEGRTVLGAIALRHELNDFLLDAAGHIGYSIRPSARRRGLAGWALGQVL